MVFRSVPSSFTLSSFAFNKSQRGRFVELLCIAIFYPVPCPSNSSTLFMCELRRLLWSISVTSSIITMWEVPPEEWWTNFRNRVIIFSLRNQSPVVPTFQCLKRHISCSLYHFLILCCRRSNYSIIVGFFFPPLNVF